MYKNPKSFFVRFLLLTLLTFTNIVLLVFLSGAGTAGLIVAVILTVINAFFLIFMFVVASINLLKYLGDKERTHLGFHLLNFIFSFFITALFSLFYFTLIFAAMIPLLAFM